MSQRAQTVHDYMLGIVLVLLVITVAIGILGNAYEPFFDPVDNEDEVMANSLVDEIVELNQTTMSGQQVDYDALSVTLANNLESVALGAGISDADIRHLRVTILSDGDVIGEYGDDPVAEPSATASRMIHSASGECTDGCQLVVEVG